MAKYTGPVLKKCRALGISPMELGIDKKSNRQVKVSRKKQSNYALQLKEKQKVKFIYGILEKQFKMYYRTDVSASAALLTPSERMAMDEASRPATILTAAIATLTTTPTTDVRMMTLLRSF